MQLRIKAPLTVALTASTLVLLFTLQVLSTHNWDPKSLLLLGDGPLQTDQVPEGYDAQWHYQIALDPLGAADNLDWPSLRYQRIVFPLAARALAFGTPAGIPYAMLLLNIAAVGLGCWAAGWLLRARGASPWWAVLAFLSFPSLLSIRLTLLEPMAVALGLAGWAFGESHLQRGGRFWQWGLALLMFLLASLAKEIGLLFPLGFAFWLLIRGQRREAAGVFAVSVLPFLLLRQFLLGQYGPALEAMTQLLWIPFSGLAALKDPAARGLVVYTVLVPTWVLLALVVTDLWPLKLTKIPAETLILLGHIALLAILPTATWQDPLAVIRTALGLLASAAIWLAARRPRALKIALGWWTPLLLILILVPNLL